MTEKSHCLRETLGALRERFESELSKSFSQITLEDALRQGALHALFPGGKRLRPLCVIALAIDLGGNFESSFSPAAAIELFHTSTLIHDDLPCLDNDDYRRGKPTVHKQFGEAIAVLTADVLLGVCFEWVTNTNVGDPHRLAIQKQLAVAYRRVCNGQMMDICSPPERPDLKIVHREKTGALFAASFAVGALTAHQNDEIVQRAFSLGESFGVLFQYLDDYLDAHGDPLVRGRPRGSDEKNLRVTLLGESLSQQRERMIPLIREVDHRIQLLSKMAPQKSLPLLLELLSSQMTQCRAVV